MLKVNKSVAYVILVGIWYTQIINKTRSGIGAKIGLPCTWTPPSWENWKANERCPDETSWFQDIFCNSRTTTVKEEAWNQEISSGHRSFGLQFSPNGVQLFTHDWLKLRLNAASIVYIWSLWCEIRVCSFTCTCTYTHSKSNYLVVFLLAKGKIPLLKMHHTS